MNDIIDQKYCKGNSEGRSADMAKVTGQAAKRSSALGSVDELYLDIDLDELSEDPSLRSYELYRMLCDKYEEEKKKFESSHSDIVKNGTYARKFILIDPIDHNNVSVYIIMQKYKNKKNRSTRTFYGGLFMRRLPYLIRQAITILSEREAAGMHGGQGTKDGKKPRLQDYCRSWGITIGLYYSFFDRIRRSFSPLLGDCSRKQLKEYLGRLCYC